MAPWMSAQACVYAGCATTSETVTEVINASHRDVLIATMRALRRLGGGADESDARSTLGGVAGGK